MDETTTVLEPETEATLTAGDIHDAFDTLIGVFEFFQKIIDTLAGFIQPLFESLFSSILG